MERKWMTLKSADILWFNNLPNMYNMLPFDILNDGILHFVTQWAHSVQQSTR